MINPNIRMTAEMEVVRMSYYFRTLIKKDYSTGTDEPFYNTFTTHIDKPFDNGNPVLVEHHIKYMDLYKFITRYKITRIPDEFKAIYTSYNPIEKTMLEMTPSYIFFEENRKHRDFTRGYITQNKALDDFIKHCDKSITTRNVIIVYEMNFYDNIDETDAITYKHRFFDIKNDRYNRFNKSWTDGFKIKDMTEPEPKPKIEIEPKPKQKTKKQQQQQKKKLMKEKQKLTKQKQKLTEQKQKLETEQYQQPEDSDTETDTTDESDTTDTTDETIDEIIPETYKKYNISFNNHQTFTIDDKEEIHFLVSDFCSRNPAFKQTMDSHKCLCVVIPIHYDKEYFKQGLHFTAYFYNNKYDRNDTIHIYIENERISHITKRTVETLF